MITLDVPKSAAEPCPNNKDILRSAFNDALAEYILNNPLKKQTEYMPIGLHDWNGVTN